MAFKHSNLTVIAYASGWTMWHYHADTKESITDIRSNPKYFGAMWGLCACGDIIYITCNGYTEQYQIREIKQDYVALGVA